MQLSVKKSFLVVVVGFGIIALFVPSAAAQGCGHWAEVLLQGFLPRQIDERALREFSNFSPQEYFEAASNIESSSLAQLTQGHISVPEVELRLRFVLQKFYAAGGELYGIRLNPDNLVIVPQMAPNAFATGSWIGFNQGTLRYFLDPVQYLVAIRAFTPSGYTVHQYNVLVANFGWKNDWNSIYFILAHEAAHNLMRHRDERIFTIVQDMFQTYKQAVLNHRKDIAHGRSGVGAKRYLWQSLQNFLGAFGASTKNRTGESEADVVALRLLQRTGFDPAIAITASRRMALLVSPSPIRGWQGAMTEALCSTHPDWMLRIQESQRSLNCLRFSRELCERHIAFPVEDFLSQFQKGMAELDQYQQETVAIPEMTPDGSSPRYEVKVEVRPKDAQLLVDGEETSPGKLRLAVGQHTLSVSKEGFSASEKIIVVFPDVHPKVKIKLKKKRR